MAVMGYLSLLTADRFQCCTHGDDFVVGMFFSRGGNSPLVSLQTRFIILPAAAVRCRGSRRVYLCRNRAAFSAPSPFLSVVSGS